MGGGRTLCGAAARGHHAGPKGVGEEVEVVGPKGPVVLPAKPDSKVAKGTVHVGHNHIGFSATELIDASVPVTDLTVVSK